MKKSTFLDTLSFASEEFGKLSAGKKKDRYMYHDGDILSSAKHAGLEASGTPGNCAISRAIIVVHEERGNAIAVFAAVEAAWEQYLAQETKSVAA
jgi:hypothetical protein